MEALSEYVVAITQALDEPERYGITRHWWLLRRDGRWDPWPTWQDERHMDPVRRFTAEGARKAVADFIAAYPRQRFYIVAVDQLEAFFALHTLAGVE